MVEINFFIVYFYLFFIFTKKEKYFYREKAVDADLTNTVSGRNPTLSFQSLRRTIFVREESILPPFTLYFPPMQSLFKARRSFCSLNHLRRTSTCLYLLRSAPFLSLLCIELIGFLFLCCSRFGRRKIGNYNWKKLYVHPSNCCRTSKRRNRRGHFLPFDCLLSYSDANLIPFN